MCYKYYIYCILCSTYVINNLFYIIYNYTFDILSMLYMLYIQHLLYAHKCRLWLPWILRTDWWGGMDSNVTKVCFTSDEDNHKMTWIIPYIYTRIITYTLCMLVMTWVILNTGGGNLYCSCDALCSKQHTLLQPVNRIWACYVDFSVPHNAKCAT